MIQQYLTCSFESYCEKSRLCTTDYEQLRLTVTRLITEHHQCERHLRFEIEELSQEILRIANCSLGILIVTKVQELLSAEEALSQPKLTHKNHILQAKSLLLNKLE